VKLPVCLLLLVCAKKATCVMEKTQIHKELNLAVRVMGIALQELLTQQTVKMVII